MIFYWYYLRCGGWWSPLRWSERLLRAPATPSLSPMVEMGQKGLSMVKIAQGWARVSRAILAESVYLWLWMWNKGSPSLIYSFFSGGVLAHGFWKPYGLGQLFRVFSSFLLFSSLFYIFSSLLGILAIFRGILDIFWRKMPFGGILGLFEAF